jgi:transposase
VVQIDISEEERILLKNYFKTSPIKLIRLKAQAVVMRSEKTPVKNISKFLFVSYRSVERWIKDFSTRRMASIFSRRLGNEYASKLTRWQKDQIKKVLSQKPSDFGLPFEFWNIPQIKKYVYSRFGVVYESDRSYHFLLEFGNLSFKCPDKFSVERNETLIAERMEEIYGEIIPLLEDPSWEVFCSDETRMLFQAIIRRAWLKKGEKTVIKVENKDEHQNYLGFLNQRTFKCHIFPIVWGRAPEIIRATTEFLKLYPNKKVAIIWDNGTHHKGILMRQALSKRGPLKRVHLIPLPPYAPDQNPIEKVWSYAKNKLSNRQDKNFEETKGKFMRMTNNQNFFFQI